MADINFEMVLKSASGLPLVKIDRAEFLRKELRNHCAADVVDIAIAQSPATAGIPVETINAIADKCVNFETNKVSGISFVAGLPGGIAMLGTIPADLAQFTGHQLRIAQKLAYLYGWGDLFGKDGMDDGTQDIMTLFLGVMFGVSGAAGAIQKIAAKAAAGAAKKLPQKALTKGVIYPIVKQVAKLLSQRMTKDIFAKGVSKAIPVVGGVLSGGLTYVTFKPMSKKLQKHLQALPLATEPYADSADDVFDIV
ncbi:MAG: hypothetical protein LBN00_06645 [Oscillospiraceae bacterium]|jgi:hypothetical protein|nr:hypothetical protein [Oscillospiraceae bacterium]